MRATSSPMTASGQITVPAEIQEHLGLAAGDAVEFSVTEDGTVQVQPAKYPTLASLRGVAGSLPEPLTWDEMIEIAYEDRFAEKYGR
jgi:antitoxin PrlF